MLPCNKISRLAICANEAKLISYITYFPIFEHSALSAATAAKRYFPSGDGEGGEYSGEFDKGVAVVVPSTNSVADSDFRNPKPRPSPRLTMTAKKRIATMTQARDLDMFLDNVACKCNERERVNNKKINPFNVDTLMSIKECNRIEFEQTLCVGHMYLIDRWTKY